MRSADDPIKKIISTLDSVPIEGSSKLIALSPGKFGIDFIDDFFKYVVEADRLSVSQAEKKITDTSASISGIATLRGYTDLGITLDFRVKDDEVVITLYGSLRTSASLLQGIFPWISVKLLGITVAFHQQFSILSILYHVNIVIGQINALAVPVDISALENKYWQLSIAEGTEKPISLDQVASLMCGFLPSSFFPESFSEALSGLKMNGISSIFNADSNEVISISAGITVANGWDIAPKISLKPGLQLIFTLNNPTNEYARQFVGIVRGSFAIDTVTVPVFVQVNLERGDSTWMIGLDPESEGVTLPSISSLFTMAGGEDFTGALPEGLRNIPAINVSRLEVDFSPAKKNFDLIAFAANTASPWEVIDGFLTVQSLSFQFDLINLNTPSERKIGCFLCSTFSITDSVWIYFNVDKDAQSTDWVLSGGLPSGKTLNLTDLARVMLHDLVIIPEEAPDISFDTLDIKVIPGKSMDFTAGSKSKWVLIEDKLSIDAFTFSFNYNNLALPPGSKFSGSLDTKITIANLPIQLSTKIDATGSWSFDGSTAKGQRILVGDLISDLSDKFGISVPKPLESLNLQNIGIHFVGASKGEKGFKEFSAGCEGVFSIFNVDMDVAVNIDLKKNNTTASPTYSKNVAGSLKLHLADGSSQTFTIGFSENLQKEEFTASWTSSPGNELSIGGIVETLVSWITGEVFGLAPPWDFLDKIRFGSLNFKFDIKSREMTFSIPIQPINFGMGRINAFSVIYRPSDSVEDPQKKKGVYVTLDGSFSWQTTSSKPLTWDATKPDTTPAPPGGKFLDLRLLALGQHVKVDGLAGATNVEAAMGKLTGLPSDPDELMKKIAEGTALSYDPGVSWLVAADFGILRFGDNQAPKAPSLLGERSLVSTTPTSGYLLNLSLIFSDPNLYGLRLALAGPAAKIFAGLALEVMYRKISDTLGVFQTELKLPDAMRSFEAGVFTITLPVLALEVYTNGDFKVDLGFPWKMNFSRSFMIQGIIPPGIPVLGAGGFYFGKLSSGSCTKVPRATNGSFNPVIIFGLGLMLGVGKEIDKGIFKAGISITVTGVIEGIIAKWNPNTPAIPSGNDIQDSYYFWLQGTLGIVGKLFGSVDFGIVKAAVNVQLALYAQITYESYADIPISVMASVSVSLTLVINLGLFKINLNFSFSITIKETLVIKNPQSGIAPPWQVAPGGTRASLSEIHAGRLRSLSRAASTKYTKEAVALNWDNYQAPLKAVTLEGYFVPVLTASGTEPCYVTMLFLDDKKKVDSLDGDNLDLTSFQALCRQVLKWVVAASLSGDWTEIGIDEYTVHDKDEDNTISEPTLIEILENYLASGVDGTSPIPAASINTFMGRRFCLKLGELDPNVEAKANGIVFPMPPDLIIERPPFNDNEGLRYRFSDSNKVDKSSLKDLSEFFSKLAVQVEKETKEELNMAPRVVSPEYVSMTTFVFEDFFLLLARQMIQMARDVLRNFKYPVKEGDSINTILAWISENGGNTGEGALTAQDIIEANSGKTLKEGITICIGAEHILSQGDTLASIAQKASLDAIRLASYNADNKDILRPGVPITFKDQDYIIKSDDTLASLMGTLGLTFGQVVSTIESVPSGAALKPSGKVYLPAVSYRASYSDTLSSLADYFSMKYCGDNSHSGEILQSLVTRNAWVEGVLKPGAIIEISEKTHTITLEDSLGSLAGLFGYQLNSFIDFVKNTALNPLALLMLPGMPHKVSAGESLGSISKNLGISVGILAQSSDNLDVEGIFFTGENSRIDLPHLNQLKLKEILSHIQREEFLNHLGGMASRYMLHGVCLPFRRLSYEVSAGDTFTYIASCHGYAFAPIDLARANAYLPDILTEGTLTYQDSSGKKTPYEVKSGDTLDSIAVSFSQVLQIPKLSLEELLKNTDMEVPERTDQGKRALLRPSAVLVIPIITFQGIVSDEPGYERPEKEEAGLYQLTGQQFSVPNLTATGKYSFILRNSEELSSWVSLPKDGLEVVIKNDEVANDLKTGYEENIRTINEIRQALQAWGDPALANEEWWSRDITLVKPQELGVGPIYQLQTRKYPFPSIVPWQSPENVPLFPGDDIDSASEILADKDLLKIWLFPDNLAKLASEATTPLNLSLYTGTFNEATSKTDEKRVTPYSWGTIINFTVKKVAPVAGYLTPGLTYEILGANEHGIALLEGLLAALHDPSSSVKDIAILYRAGQPGAGAEGLRSDGVFKYSQSKDEANRVASFIYQVNLTTVTLPSTNSPMNSTMISAASGSKHFADLEEGELWDYLRLLWEGSITRSEGYYLYYSKKDVNTGLPEAIFNDKGEAILSLMVIYDTDKIASYMNCAITGDQIDLARSVVFASCSDAPSCPCSNAPSCPEARGLSERVPIVSPGIIPLEVKRNERRESKETSENIAHLINMYHMLGYSIKDSNDFKESDICLPMGPMGSESSDGHWVYHQALPYTHHAKKKPLPIEVYNAKAKKVSIESPYAAIGMPLSLSLVWQDIFGNRMGCAPNKSCQIPTGYTDALIGLGQWPGMACHYCLLAENSKSLFKIQFDFNTDGYLLKKENNPSEEEINKTKDKTWRDLLAYVRIYFQLLGTGTALSVETSLDLPNIADLAMKDNASQKPLKHSLLSWIWDIIGYLSECLRLGCVETFIQPTALKAKSELDTSRILELEFNPADINPKAIFNLTADFIIKRDEVLVHSDLKDTKSAYLASTPLPPLTKDNSLKDFAQGFEAATRTKESCLKIALGTDRFGSSRSSLWAVRISNTDPSYQSSINPQGSISYSVSKPGQPKIFAPKPLFTSPMNLKDVDIYDYKPGIGISKDVTRTLNFIGVDMDGWLKIFLNAVEKFLAPEFAAPIIIVGKKEKNPIIDQLLESKKMAAAGLSKLLVPVLSEAASKAATDDLIKAQKIFEEDLLIHLSNFYSTEVAIQFEATLKSPENLRLFGPVPPGSDGERSISLTAAKMALKKAGSDSTEDALLTFLLQKQEDYEVGDSLKINAKSIQLSPIYQITSIEHQIGEIPGIDGYEASSWLTFVNASDILLQKSLGTFDVPLILRALPTPPSMVEQYDLSNEKPQDDSSELDRVTHFDYSLVYSRDYHEPQDKIELILVLSKNQERAMARNTGKGIEYELARFVTIYPNIEADLEEKLKGISAEAGDIDGASIALNAFAKYVNDVAMVLRSTGDLPANTSAIKSSKACNFSINESANADGLLEVEVIIGPNWPEGISNPEVRIDGYVRENNLYRKSEGTSYLTASEGLKIPRRQVILPSLNILEVQNIISSARVSRNKFSVKLNKGTSSTEVIRDVDSRFHYTTSDISFANSFRPFKDSYIDVDISKIGSISGQSVRRTLREHFEALLRGLLIDKEELTLNIQLVCNYCFKVCSDMPEVNRPMILLPYRNLMGEKSLADLSDLIIEWLNANLIRKNEGILRFDLTISTGITETSMPLLRMHNLRLDTYNIDY